MHKLAVMTVPLLLLASACSGGSSGEDSASWKTGKDVLDSLKTAGFACTWTGSGEQVSNTNPLTGGDDGQPAVRCDGYGVALIESKDALIAAVKEQPDSCRDLTQEEVDAAGSQSQIVLGDNFVVVPAGQFPGEAQPADFVKAFGGEAMTFVDLYKMICPDATVATPNPSASAIAASEATLAAELTSAAMSMEIYYTENGNYPASPAEAGYMSSADGVNMEGKTSAAGSYCLTATDSVGSKRYYNSVTGGLTDTPC
jgi:hypothetical protein